MSNLIPEDPHSVTPFNFFNLFNQMENLMVNTFQSTLLPMNNTSFTDQGSEYIFTLTLKDLKREHIQLAVENQHLILTVKQVTQTHEEIGQSYQAHSFSQSFNLYDVDADKITAHLNNDTLTIKLPKQEAIVVNHRVINIL